MIQINRYSYICDTCHKKINNFTALSIQAGNIPNIIEDEDGGIPYDDEVDNRYFPLIHESNARENQHIMVRCWNEKCPSHKTFVYMDLDGKVVKLFPISKHWKRL